METAARGAQLSARRSTHLPARWIRVINAVCARHRIHPIVLMSGSRDKHLVAARFEAWWELRQAFNASLKAIGWRFGDYDHTSVLNGICKHCARHGIECRLTKPSAHTESEMALVRDMFEAGAVDKDIAAALREHSGRICTSQNIYCIRKKLRLLGTKKVTA